MFTLCSSSESDFTDGFLYVFGLGLTNNLKHDGLIVKDGCIKK